MIKTLTNKQSKILEWYRTYVAKKGYTPTYAEAGKDLGLTAGAVFFHVKNLVELGYLHLGTMTKKIEIGNNIQKIPVLGYIACGEPIDVHEEIVEYLDIGTNLLSRSGEYYGLIAKGNSMIEAGINDGDYLIIKKQEDVDNGDIAVVIDRTDESEEKATLKRVYKTPTALMLKPANPSFPTVFLTECLVRGRLVKVIKSY